MSVANAAIPVWRRRGALLAVVALGLAGVEATAQTPLAPDASAPHVIRVGAQRALKRIEDATRCLKDGPRARICLFFQGIIAGEINPKRLFCTIERAASVQVGEDGGDVRPEALEKVDAATPLLGSGIGLDSVEALTLASEIEGEFDIHFEDQELTPDLFRSLGSLSTSIAAKCQARTGNSPL